MLENYMSLQGYNTGIDETTGQPFVINLKTGEVQDAINVTVATGTIFYTPEQQEAYKRRKEHEALKQTRIKANKPLGDFFFTPSCEQFKGISPETVTRLIYLNTFIGFENNTLMQTARTSISRRDLPDILHISKATVTRFLKEVCPDYLIEQADGTILSNKSVFWRGHIKRNCTFPIYQKFYINGVRALYQSVSRNNHRQLGYFFKLLPFINVEYNLLCTNPLETELDKIELLSVADFCKLINYDVLHVNKLLDIYRNVYFDVQGKQERFCAITYEGINKAGAKICINPNILYCGSDFEQVKIISAFCKK